MHGRGCIKKDETKYYGDIRHNLKHGTGRYNYENGDNYDGKWKND